MAEAKKAKKQQLNGTQTHRRNETYVMLYDTAMPRNFNEGAAKAVAVNRRSQPRRSQTN